MTTQPPLDLRFRLGVPGDLPAVVELLADDPLGATRESPGPAGDGYDRAFQAIDADPNHLLLVGELDGRVVAVLQLSFLPNLTYEGAWRAQVEGVRVASDLRSRGVGRLLLEEAIRRAREMGCRLVQLTTDRRRPAALEFYESLGFEASHVGFKLHLHDRWSD